MQIRRQGQGDDDEMGGLDRLPGLEEVQEQLAGVIAVIRTEAARREAGINVARPAWKNLVFAGRPGSGKSRVAEAIGRIYQELGVLASGHLVEVASVDLVGDTSEETSRLVRQAAGFAHSGVLMINDAHADIWVSGRQAARSLLDVLTHNRDELAIILAGRPDGVRRLLDASPALASRFPVTIEFPGYTATQLGAIFATLAAEAGFTLTPAARRKACGVLTDVGGENARSAVWLLQQVVATQAKRISTAPQPIAPPDACTIRAADIPDHVDPNNQPTSAESEWPGQYL